MKYKINDKVLVKVEGQLVHGKVLKSRKWFIFGWRYLLSYTVDLHDEGRFLYSKLKYKSYWEGQIINKL